MPLNLNYKSISIFQMKPSFLAIIISLILNISVYAQNYVDYTWQYPQYGGHSINEVKWISDQTFIAVGDQGMLLMTYDNGATWEIKQIKTLRNFKGIWVKNQQEILVLGSYDNSGTELYKTTDGGNLWLMQQNPGLSENIKSISFADSVRGMAVSSGYIYRTSNGNTWSSTFYTGNLQSGDLSPDGVAVVGTLTGGIKSSINYGSSFSESNPQAGTSTFRRIKFVNSLQGWVGGDDGKILKTSDGGNEWTLLTTSPYYSIGNDMAAISVDLFC
jgi:photosystem II stability/assembly factor-like uncharacterized protein